MRAIFKYPGSKWAIADWIISFFPAHHSYLEPFLGSGAVLFTKGRSPIETVNDLDGDVYNLFQWIRDEPEKLANAIYWTPYSRQAYDMACDAWRTETDSFQRAVAFYVRMMMGHGFRTNERKVGWKNDIQGREAAYAAKQWCETPEAVMSAAERLRGVQIENRQAVTVIERFNYPNVLIYADPPYLLRTRHGKQYLHEMTDKDHRDLLDVLKAHKGPVLLSGYESAPILERETLLACVTPADILSLRQATLSAILAGYGREVESSDDIDLDLMELEQKKTKS